MKASFEPQRERRQYRLGALRVDVATLTAIARGETIGLGRKAVQALVILCEHAGDVVPHALLVRAVWQDEVVDDSSLWQTIYLLRKTLSAHAAPNAIDNVRGRGYRLTGPVEEAVQNARPAPATRPSARRLAALLIGLSLLLAVGSRIQTAGLTGESARLLRLGRFYFETQTVSGLQRSEAILKQLVAREPGSARAFAALANTESALVWAYGPSPSARVALSEAERDASTALHLDPASSDALLASAVARELASGHFGVADAAYERAVALDPHNTDVNQQYGISLLMRGRLRDAITHFRAAASTDPTTAGLNAWLSFAYYLNHQPEAALPFAVEALDLGDDADDARARLGLIYAQQRNVRRAVTEFDFLRACCPRLRLAYVAQAYAAVGRKADAATVLRGLRIPEKAPAMLWLNVAYAQIALEERGAALRSLQHVRRRDPVSRSLTALDPHWDAVRGDARFAAFSRIDAGRYLTK